MRWKSGLFMVLLSVILVTNVSAAAPSETVYGDQMSGGARNFAGGRIVLSDDYSEPVNVFGGEVILEGSFSRRVNVFGGSVELDGEFDESVKVYGGKVVASTDSVFHEELNVTSGSFRFEGHVGDNLNVFSPYAVISEGSSIGGDLLYSSEDIEIRGDVGGTVRRKMYSEDERMKEFSLPSMGWMSPVYSFGYKFLMAAVVLAFFPVFFMDSARDAFDEWYRSGMTGLLSSVLLPVLSIGLMVTLVGIPLGLVLMGIFVVSIVLGFVVGAFEIGRRIMERVGYSNRWFSLAVGLLVALVVESIPIIGGIFKTVLDVLGMGAVYVSIYVRYRER